MPAATQSDLRSSNKNSVESANSSFPQKRFVRSGFSTQAFWAILFFVALNAGLWMIGAENKKAAHGSFQSSRQPTVRDMWDGTGSIDYAVNGYLELKHAPTVVLLGSSLVMHPFWALDLTVTKNIPDIFHHRNSIVLSKLLRQTQEKDLDRATVYSLATFGQMSSDAYITVNELLKNPRRPDWLVLGMAPRDYGDFDVHAPMATPTFKRLVNLSNFPTYASAFLPSLQDKLDFVLSHTCFFYGKRWRLQHELDKAVNHELNNDFVPPIADPNTSTEAAMANERKGFSLEGTAEERWSNSVSEYRRRYRNIETRDLSVQYDFLSKLLTVCKQRGIKVVLVNMPLTNINRSVMPDGFYKTFRNQIHTIVGTRPNVTLVDLGDSKEFVDSDFWDTAHLNQFGGAKLVQHIVKAITSGNVRR